ncbi:MAG: hypothetical protein ACOVMQ_03700 [Cyclobacteriaceae bacterium]
MFLSHLSKNNNTPEIAEALFKSVAGETQIIVAPRNEETEVFTVSSNLSSPRVKRKSQVAESQLKLF